ncbi:MAG TPA: sigma-70 family RNA polymerase sigma factor [Candidatus Binatia bacterium]|nr:sigma-70 family RNA polymerase sigma factor [Candidatus Binatia bacterium]
MAADANLDRIIEAVVGGDRESYRQVILRCEAMVRVILAAILPDPGSIDDLAQEVFVTAFRKLDQYKLGTDFELWLKAITRNLALNERKRWFRQVRFRDRFEAEVETCLEPLITGFGEGYEGSILEALRECLEALDQPARGVTEDYYFREFSTSQIARSLSQKVAWVRLVLFRARAALGACLQNKGVD